MGEVRKLSDVTISTTLAGPNDIFLMAGENDMLAGAPTSKRPKVEMRAVSNGGKDANLSERADPTHPTILEKQEMLMKIIDTYHDSGSITEESIPSEVPAFDSHLLETYGIDANSNVGVRPDPTPATQPEEETPEDFEKYKAYEHRANVLDIPFCSKTAVGYGPDSDGTPSVNDMMQAHFDVYPNVCNERSYMPTMQYGPQDNMDMLRDERLESCRAKPSNDKAQDSVEGMGKESLSLCKKMGLLDPNVTYVSSNPGTDRNAKFLSQHHEIGPGLPSYVSNSTNVDNPGQNAKGIPNVI